MDANDPGMLHIKEPTPAELEQLEKISGLLEKADLAEITGRWLFSYNAGAWLSPEAARDHFASATFIDWDWRLEDPYKNLESLRENAANANRELRDFEILLSPCDEAKL